MTRMQMRGGGGGGGGRGGSRGMRGSQDNMRLLGGYEARMGI